MVKKRKPVGAPGEHGAECDKKRRRKREPVDVPVDLDLDCEKNGKRNRASPWGICQLKDRWTPDQISDVGEMQFDSMLSIKCPILHNGVITWFAGTYDKNSREFVIPGRGRIPLNERTVFRTLGLPIGDIPVVYALDRETEAVLGPKLFPTDGNSPKITRLWEILRDMKEAGEGFKQIFLMYIMCTVIRPTTCNKVSSRCYPAMASVKNVHEMNWAKFVADQLHEELSIGKFNTACLTLMQLLYVDSIDIGDMDLVLPEGRFAVNIWSKEDIDSVLAADLQLDGKSYGKLQLKPEFGFNYSLFGGVSGFDKWVDTHSHPSCPNEQKKEVANAMGTFVSGMVGLLGNLMGSWTQMLPSSSAGMAHELGNLTDRFVGSKTTSTRPLGRRARSSAAPGSSKGPASADSEGSQPTDENSRDADGLGRDGRSSHMILRSAAVQGSSRGFSLGGSDDNDANFCADGVSVDGSSSDDHSDGDDSSADGDYVLVARNKTGASQEQHALAQSSSPAPSEFLPPQIPVIGANAGPDGPTVPQCSADLVDDILSTPAEKVASDHSSIPEASALAEEDSNQFDGMDLTEPILAAPHEGIEQVKRRRLQTIGQVHNTIVRDVIASEFLNAGVDLRAKTDVISAVINPPKKMAPRRKLVSKDVAKPTRSSPRLLAERRPAGAVSNTDIDVATEPDIASELLNAGVDLRAKTDVTSVVIIPPKKMTPGSKQVSKDCSKPTRSSPRLLAERRPARAASNTDIAVATKPDIARKVFDATYKRKKTLKVTLEPSRTSPRLLAKQIPGGDVTTSGIDVDVRSSVAVPDVVAEVDLGDGSLAGGHSVADNTTFAPPSVPNPPVDTASKSVAPASSVLAGSSVGVEGCAISSDPIPHVSFQAGSITCPLGVAAPILSDAVRTCVSKTSDIIAHDVHVPGAEATHVGMTAPSDVNAVGIQSTIITDSASLNNTASFKSVSELQEKIDEVAAKNGGFFPASMLFLEFVQPVTSDAPPHAPIEEEAVGFPGVVAGSAAGPSASMHIPEASASSPTDEPLDAEDVLPLSYAVPTSTVPNVLSARDKGKPHGNDVSGVISLDDLLGEKMAVEKSCSTSRTFPVGKSSGSEDGQFFCTPAMPAPHCIIDVPSCTPKSRIRMERVSLPSKYLLPPYITIRSTAHQDALYRKVIIHSRSSKVSRLKDTIIMEIGPMWVSTGELADSVKPDGELSNTVVEIGVYVLQQSCRDNSKVIFPWIATSYLLDHNFHSNVLKKHFRKDDKYKLSHKNLLCFPVLQKLGKSAKALSHWYMLSLNLVAKRFEILDSIRGPEDEGMIDHATRLMDAIKKMFLVNYKDSRKQIQDYELVYIPAPRQDTEFDCGFFMLKFLELWDGRTSPAITFDQIPELRKVLTARWLEHADNKLTEWRPLLDRFVF